MSFRGRNSRRSNDRRDSFRDRSDRRDNSPIGRRGNSRNHGSSHFSSRAPAFRDRPSNEDRHNLRNDAFRSSGWNDAPNSRDLLNVQLKREDYLYLERFDRVFYEPLPTVNQRSAEEVANIRYEMGITVHPENCCAPVTSFEEAFKSRQMYVLETIQKLNFRAPTPIQCQSWPIVLSGHDMIGIAETGSGKTLGYLLPGIIHMLGQPDLAPGEGPMALILAPTRELSLQIFEECEKFGKPCGVKSACIYGGARKGPQIRDLQLGVHLVVATPGRMIDMLESEETNLRRVTYLVLDEADRMLDMGFEPQIRKIVDLIRPDRQTVLWSATWPRSVEDIAAEFLRSPFKVTIGSEDLKANHNITQKFEFLTQRERKLDKLVELLRSEQGRGRILVFCAKKRIVDSVTMQLRSLGFGALCIHGDKEQAEREWVLEEFKQGSSPIMVATDVAQRGLDIKDVYCVVNYDMPSTGEDYVHRIGRTGRAGARGLSISLVSDQDSRIMNSIVKVLEEAHQEVPFQLRRFANSNESGFRSGANAMPLRREWDQ